MKVGLDSILLGCWASIERAKKILDVGTGCGILSMICAQRNPNALIEGIDIHSPSVMEAERNFLNSPWYSRLSAKNQDYNECKDEAFDYIISNPPYFNSGVDKIDSPRKMARQQASLSPIGLLRKAKELLDKNGIVGMVFPYTQTQDIVEEALKFGFLPLREMKIKGRAELDCKRIMMEFILNGGKNDSLLECESKELILENDSHIPTDEFRSLCRDFYLKF